MSKVQIDRDLFFAIRDHFRHLHDADMLTDFDVQTMIQIEKKDSAIYAHDHYLDDRARTANICNDFKLTRQGKR